MQLPAEFQKQSQNAFPKWLLSQFFESQKKRVQAVVAERYPGAVGNATSVFDGAAISGCAREVC
jgi:hypothetical protein